VRDYVVARLSAQVLTRLYHLTTDPETIPFDALTEKFVVKPTHGSGWVKVVTDKSKTDRAEIIKTCNEWLGQNYYKLSGEWVYRDIEPRIIVEEFINDGSNETPNDYKIFIFGGKAEMIQVDVDRYIHHRRRLHTLDWQKIDVRYEYDDVLADIPRPVHLQQMIAAAESLAKEFDFMRVDFYDTGKRIYFGELTTMPDNGRGLFTPRAFDLYLGSKWKLPSWPVKRGWL
jgi:TupA-like ATPgrasp